MDASVSDATAVRAAANDPSLPAFTEADEKAERSKMTKAEKAEAKADMYGQVHPNETPELIASSLVRLEEELEKLPGEARVGYSRAVERCPDLVGEKDKLKFLRCEVFNADLAALRLTKYWDKRIEIFGEERAFLPMTLDGAFRDDVSAIKQGFMRCDDAMMDTNRRRVLFVDPSLLDHSKHERSSVCRSIWYITHAVLEDETTQKRGVVFVAYPHRAKYEQFDRALVKMNITSIRGCIPVRVGAFHICQPPIFFKVIFPLLKLLMGKRLRARIKVHTGSEEDLVNRMGKFGIGADAVPSELGGNLILNQEAWVERRREAGL